MLIFTKYSNERKLEFRIRTDILQDDAGNRRVQKRAAHPQAWQHIQKIYERSLALERDLRGTGLSVNDCELCQNGVQFPYLEGETLEERLDGLLKQKKTEEVLSQIEQYLAAFTQTGLKEFQATPEFVQVFGPVRFDRKQYSRSVSDVDMIFSNAILQEKGYELIDYEWTFSFPVPVKFLVYRCLHYYVYGNDARRELTKLDIYSRFDITEAEQKQFAAMEQRFQSYILGEYTPLWMQYEDISDGVVDVIPAVKKESGRKSHRAADVFYDNGTGFGAKNCVPYETADGDRVMLQLELPKGTRAVRVDTRTGKCLLRMEQLTWNGKALSYESNGLLADNGDLIFDTEQPQITFAVPQQGTVKIRFLAEPLGILDRELVLNQYGRIRWMEQTKVWRMYQKLKGKKV